MDVQAHPSCLVAGTPDLGTIANSIQDISFPECGPLVLGRQEPQLEVAYSDNPATSDVDPSDLSDETERSESASDATGDLPLPSTVAAEDTLPNTMPEHSSHLSEG